MSSVYVLRIISFSIKSHCIILIKVNNKKFSLRELFSKTANLFYLSSSYLFNQN